MLSRTTGGVTTYFLYDGGTLIAEIDSTGYFLTGFVFGINGLISHHTTTLAPGGEEEGFSSQEEFFQTEGFGGGATPQWNSRYYLYDGTGNTRGVTDAGGTGVAKASYGAFGAPLQQSGEPIRFGQGGQGGAWNEGNTGMVISGHSAPTPYVPGSGQYAQPSGVGYSGGHPYGTTDLINEDDISVDERGKPFAYGRAQQGLHGLGQGMETALNVAAGFNPLVSAGSLATGRDASGRTIGWGERMTNLADMLPGGSILGVVADAGKAVKTGSKLLDEVADATETVKSVKRAKNPNRRNEIREKNFPKRVLPETERRLEDAATIDGVIYCQNCNKVLAPGEGTPEHIPGVRELWNTIGYNTSQVERKRLFNEAAKKWHCLDCQWEQGGRVHKDPYRRDYGPDYTPGRTRRRKL